MLASARLFLSEDAAFIKEALLAQDVRTLAGDIEAGMEAAQLSSSELGRRCEVSHTIVDKWRSGSARPNGKERMKELGMALGMNESELNSFLYRNGYPGLSAKNPYDSAARLLLLQHAGQSDIVQLYRQLLSRLNIQDYSAARADSLITAVMSMELAQALQEGTVSGWFRRHKRHFTADEKNIALSSRLMRFVLLYTGNTSVNELAVAGELPSGLRNLLYRIISGKPIAARYLREKLICLGLYLNMTEEEINLLLSFAGLRDISEPCSPEELALVLAVRNGHGEYPYYEYDNLSAALSRLKASPSPDRQLLEEYTRRMELSRQLTDYYSSCAQSSSASECTFEKLYTSYSDRGLMDYVHDILQLLCEEGALENSAAELFIKYTSRPGP